MKYAIVTGESKGLGQSVARLLLESGIHVFGISRSGNTGLRKLAKERNLVYEHFACDLGDIKAIESTIKEIDLKLEKKSPEMIYLVNNAAVLDPINHAVKIKHEDVAHHVQVNTVAPIMMLNSFLRLVSKMSIPLICVTITSGAAERPMYGWSLYCSTKASINMYTQTVALEQKELETDNKVIAFSPGVMDTEMQIKIRAASKDAFIDVDNFRRLKENNNLSTPDEVGEVLVNILTKPSTIKSGHIYRVQDYL